VSHGMSNVPSALNDCPLAHLAIAVNTLAESAPIYMALGFVAQEPETVAREKVRVQLFTQGSLKIELLEPAQVGEGPIAKFLQKRGPGLHHVALSCTDLDGRLKALALQGVRALPGYPNDGAAGSRVAFLDPKSTGGVLFELVQYSTN